MYLRTGQIPSNARDGATLRLSPIGCAAPYRRRYRRYGRRPQTRRSRAVTVKCRIGATSSRMELSVVQSLQHSPPRFRAVQAHICGKLVTTFVEGLDRPTTSLSTPLGEKSAMEPSGVHRGQDPSPRSTNCGYQAGSRAVLCPRMMVSRRGCWRASTGAARRPGAQPADGVQHYRVADQKSREGGREHHPSAALAVYDPPQHLRHGHGVDDDQAPRE